MSWEVPTLTASAVLSDGYDKKRGPDFWGPILSSELEIAFVTTSFLLSAEVRFRCAFLRLKRNPLTF